MPFSNIHYIWVLVEFGKFMQGITKFKVNMSSPLQFLFDRIARISTSETKKQLTTQVKFEPLDFQVVFDLNDDTNDDNVMVLPYPTFFSRSVKHNGGTTSGPLVLEGPHQAHLSFSMCHPTLSNSAINSLVSAECFPTPMPFDVPSSFQSAPSFLLMSFDVLSSFQFAPIS